MATITRIAQASMTIGLAATALCGCAVYEPDGAYAYGPYGYSPYSYYGGNYAFVPPAYGSYGLFFGDGWHDGGYWGGWHGGFHGGHGWH